MSLNSIIIMGRMARDPELRMTQSQKSVATFTLAVDRDFTRAGEERETDWIDCVAFSNTADFVHKYFSKGSLVTVCGRLQLRDWNDRDGNKRRSAEVIVDRVYFGESKKQETKPAAGAPVNVQYSEMADTDGELPFD